VREEVNREKQWLCVAGVREAAMKRYRRRLYSSESRNKKKAAQ